MDIQTLCLRYSSRTLKASHPMQENTQSIDEWQVAPVLWDAVRHAVDERRLRGQFILTGSTVIDDDEIMHTGTGRISKMSMYPMSLYESKESNGKISLRELFDNKELDIDGIVSNLSIEELIFAACRGGWPASLDDMSMAAKLLIATVISMIILPIAFPFYP